MDTPWSKKAKIQALLAFTPGVFAGYALKKYSTEIVIAAGGATVGGLALLLLGVSGYVSVRVHWHRIFRDWDRYNRPVSSSTDSFQYPILTFFAGVGIGYVVEYVVESPEYEEFQHRMAHKQMNLLRSLSLV